MIRRASCHVNMVGVSESVFSHAAKADEGRKSSVWLPEVLISKVDVVVERVEGDGINDVIVIVF